MVFWWIVVKAKNLSCLKKRSEFNRKKQAHSKYILFRGLKFNFYQIRFRFNLESFFIFIV